MTNEEIDAYRRPALDHLLSNLQHGASQTKLESAKAILDHTFYTFDPIPLEEETDEPTDA